MATPHRQDNSKDLLWRAAWLWLSALGSLACLCDAGSGSSGGDCEGLQPYEFDTGECYYCLDTGADTGATDVSWDTGDLDSWDDDAPTDAWDDDAPTDAQYDVEERDVEQDAATVMDRFGPGWPWALGLDRGYTLEDAVADPSTNLTALSPSEMALGSRIREPLDVRRYGADDIQRGDTLIRNQLFELRGVMTWSPLLVVVRNDGRLLDTHVALTALGAEWVAIARPAVGYAWTAGVYSDRVTLPDELELEPTFSQQLAVVSWTEGLGAAEVHRALDSDDVALTGLAPAIDGGALLTLDQRSPNRQGLLLATAPDGAERWRVTLDSDAVEGQVATDGQGRVYWAGRFTEARIFPDSEERVTNGAADLFVARLTPDGGIDWIVTLGGPGEDVLRSLVVSDAGEIALSGRFGEPFVLNLAEEPTPLTQGGAIVAFTPEGELSWTVQVEGDEGGRINDLAIGPEGRLCVTGFAQTPRAGFTLGAHSLPAQPAQGHTGFVAILDMRRGEVLEADRLLGDDAIDGVGVSVAATSAGGCTVFGYATVHVSTTEDRSGSFLMRYQP